MIRFGLVFIAGVLVGAFGVTSLTKDVPTESSAPSAISASPIVPASSPGPEHAVASSESNQAPEDPAIPAETVTAPSDNSPRIPLVYRRTMGPPVRRISFAEKYQIFENEPVDEAWAYGMETGMNNYLAILGPDTGTVFEFVQCRSTSCVLAGYVLEGYDNQSAGMVGEMAKQPWWDGGSSSYSLGGEAGGYDRFVILISRYNSSGSGR